jgi:hypothetical protein
MPSTINQVLKTKITQHYKLNFQLTNITHVIKNYWVTSNWTC